MISLEIISHGLDIFFGKGYGCMNLREKLVLFVTDEEMSVLNSEVSMVRRVIMLSHSHLEVTMTLYVCERFEERIS